MPRLEIPFPDPPQFAVLLDVRVSDLNYGNHLGHDALVSLLHEARVRFFRSLGFDEHDVEGAGILLVDLAVTYHREVFYGQVLQVEIAAGDLASRGCALYYRVTDRASGERVAMARTGIVFVDRVSRRVISVPAGFRAAVTR